MGKDGFAYFVYPCGKNPTEITIPDGTVAIQSSAIAVCKDTVTYLCEVNEEELIYRENSTGGIHVDNFKAILDKYKKDKPED